MVGSSEKHSLRYFRLKRILFQLSRSLRLRSRCLKNSESSVSNIWILRLEILDKILNLCPEYLDYILRTRKFSDLSNSLFRTQKNSVIQSLRILDLLSVFQGLRVRFCVLYSTLGISICNFNFNRESDLLFFKKIFG